MNSASPSRDSGQKAIEPDGLEQECFTRWQMGFSWSYGLVTGVVVGIGGTLIGQSLLRERVSDPPDTTAASAPATPGGLNPNAPPLGAQNRGRPTNPSMPPHPNLTEGCGEGDGLSNGRRPDGPAKPANTGQDKKSTAPEPNDDRKGEPKPTPRPLSERIAEDINRGGVER
jgi:hypothetical protein